MSDDDRRDWINSDEALYNWQRRSGLSMREFIKQNRSELTAMIDRALNGGKSPEQIAYSPGGQLYEYSAHYRNPHRL
jgi:hypothetical protein